MGSGHRIWTAPFPALERRFLDWAGETRSDPLEPLDGLVPSNALLRRLGSLLAGDGEAWVNVRLGTLLDLAREVLLEGTPSKLVAVEEAERLLLVGRAAAASADPAFRDGAERRPFLEALAESVRDLREACAQPDGLPQEPGGVLARYGEILDRDGLADREALLEAATARIAAGSHPGNGSGLFLYGFYDLNPLQRGLVESLRGRRLTVFFPLPGGEANRYALETLDWFTALLDTPAEALPDGDDDPSIRLARRLFALPSAEDETRTGPGKESLSILTAAGPEREAQAVARALQRERHAGTAWRDMAVLLRAPESLRRPLERALKARCIPFDSGLSLPLAEAPPAAAFLALLECLEEGFPWQAAARLLASPWLRLPGEADRARWPHLLSRSGAVGGGTRWREEWEAALARFEEDPQAGLLRETISRFHADASSLPGRGRPSQMAGALLEILAAWLPVPEEGTEGAAALECATDLVRRSGAADRVCEEVTREEFLSRLRAEAARATLPRPAAVPGGVRLAGLMDARGLSFEVVVLPGMNEGQFPRPVRQDPFLSDAVRDRAGVPVKARGHDEERFLFALAVQSARRRLILTRQRSDRSGRASTPSPFLREVCRVLYGDLVYEPAALAGRMRDEGLLHDLPVSSLEEATAQGPGALPGTLVAATLRDAFRHGAGKGHSALGDAALREALLCEEARWRPGLSPWDGLLEGSEGAALSGILSPTRLEDYGRCPFRYFCQHVLGLEGVEGHPAFREVDALNRGSLTHDVLEALFRRLMREGRLPVEEENLGEIEAIAREVATGEFERWKRKQAGIPSVLVEREWSLLRDNVRAVLEWESGSEGWVPRHVEASFGMPSEADDPDDPSTTEPLVLGGGSGAPVSFRGRIDRIDVHLGSGEARVVDYKTGRGHQRKSVDPWDEDRYQLPVYWVAARNLLVEAPVTGALYLQLTGTARERRLDQLDEPRLVRTVEGFSDSIAGGRFFLRPGRHCQWCDYASICRHEPHWRAERKIAGDPAAGAYREIKGMAGPG